MPLSTPPDPAGKGSRRVGRHGDPGELHARIVKAARQSFAAHGWAGTTIRGVARDAGVDPALVHYYFAGKQALLEASMTPPVTFVEGIAAAVLVPLDQRGEAMVQVMLDAWGDPETHIALRSVLLTAAHAEPALVLMQRTFRELLIGVVADHLSTEDREMRAALVTSQMVGFAMMRYVWAIEPLSSLPADEVIAYLAPTIQHYLGENLAQ